MAKLQEQAQEPGGSPPLPLDTPAMLAALARDVAATREDVAAPRVNLGRLSEEVRAAQERALSRDRSAREVLVSTAKHLGAQWHHTIADAERDIARVAAGERMQPERDPHRIPPALQEAYQCGDEEDHVEQALHPKRREDERVGAEGDERERAYEVACLKRRNSSQRSPASSSALSIVPAHSTEPVRNPAAVVSSTFSGEVAVFAG